MNELLWTWTTIPTYIPIIYGFQIYIKHGTDVLLANTHFFENRNCTFAIYVLRDIKVDAQEVLFKGSPTEERYIKYFDLERIIQDPHYGLEVQRTIRGKQQVNLGTNIVVCYHYLYSLLD